MKIKKRWIILMTAMTLIAVAGLCVGEPTFECDWSVISAADVAWLITATIFVLMMTPGLSFFYGGMVGAKNVISTMLQSFIAMGLISVLWVVIGFSLCFGDDIGGVIGNPLTFLMFQNVGAEVYTTPAGNVLGGATIPLALFALFQMKFAIITPSLITGSFAERVRFSAYMFFMMFFFFVIYCPLAHMTWHPEGLIAGTWDGFVIFLYHLLAIVIVFVYTFAMSWAGYKLIDSLIPMRVSEYSEKVGLDFSQHDEHYGLAHIGERELAEYEEHIRSKK